MDIRFFINLFQQVFQIISYFTSWILFIEPTYTVTIHVTAYCNGILMTLRLGIHLRQPHYL